MMIMIMIIIHHSPRAIVQASRKVCTNSNSNGNRDTDNNHNSNLDNNSNNN